MKEKRAKPYVPDLAWKSQISFYQTSATNLAMLPQHLLTI